MEMGMNVAGRAGMGTVRCKIKRAGTGVVKKTRFFGWEVVLVLVSVLETGLPGIAEPPGATITSRSAVRIRINFWRMVGVYISFGRLSQCNWVLKVSVLETGHTRYCSTSGSDPLRQLSSLIWTLSLTQTSIHNLLWKTASIQNTAAPGCKVQMSSF